MPSWETIVADRPYPTLADLQASGAADLSNGFVSSRFATIDRGAFVDGEYEREYPVGALTWQTSSQIDPAAGYGWMGRDGVAEPGDGSCLEFLQTNQMAYIRTSRPEDDFETTTTDFEPRPEMVTTFEEAQDERFDDHNHFFDEAGITPAIEELDSSWRRYFSELNGGALTAAVLEYGEGANDRHTFGAIEFVVDGVDQTRMVTLWARSIDDPRTFESGTVRVSTEDLYANVTANPVPENLMRRTPDMSLLESGFCRPVTTGIAGTWVWRSLIVGGGEVTRGSLQQMNGAFIQIGTDGTVSGSTGCRTFIGTSTIGFATLDDVNVDFTGQRCAAGEFDESEMEDLLVTLLSSDMSAVVDLEGRLFLITSEEDPVIIGHFGPD